MQAQIRELQKAIQENTQKLEEIRQQRLCAEEDIVQWYRSYVSQMWCVGLVNSC